MALVFLVAVCEVGRRQMLDGEPVASLTTEIDIPEGTLFR